MASGRTKGRRQNKKRGPRISGYLNASWQMVWWRKMLQLASKLDHLPPKPGMGYLLSILADFNIPIHRRSLERIAQLLKADKRSKAAEPAELTHTPVKRVAPLAARKNGDGRLKKPPKRADRRSERVVA